MKQRSMFYVVAVVATLTACMLVGCGSQPASQASSSSESTSSASSAASSAASSSEATSEAVSESTSSSEASEKSQDEILAELKESLSNLPAYTSVTITEKEYTWENYNEDAVAETSDAASSSAASSSAASSSSSAGVSEPSLGGETIESTSVYKFDESGDKIKTSVSHTLDDITMQYYTDGDDAVCVTDGPVYSGTTEQFDLAHAAGSKVYLEETIGDLNTLLDCVTEVEQGEIEGVMGYELTLDPQKYIETDEYLKMAADAGDPIQNAYITVGFDKDGYIAWMTRTDVFSGLTKSTLLDLTDYDKTVVDPMPEATNTYEEMEAEISAKLEEVDAQL